MATLIIWNNHYYPVNSYPGHAALSIDGDWTEHGQANSYVSWWPDDGKKGKQKSDPQLSISADLALEGYAPDHIIELPNMDAGRMMSKWRSIRNDQSKRYRFLRNNCSTVVSQVLKEGSTEGSVIERNSLIWTPLKVMRLAYGMGGQDITWNEFLTHLRMAGYITSSDSMVLRNLFKRDSRHGKNATQNSCYYSGGRSVNTKALLQWKGVHIGKPSEGMPFFKSEEGSLLTQGHLRANNEGGLNYGEEWVRGVQTEGNGRSHIRIGGRGG